MDPPSPESSLARAIAGRPSDRRTSRPWHPRSNATGMVTDPVASLMGQLGCHRKDESLAYRFCPVEEDIEQGNILTEIRATNVVWHEGHVDRSAREVLLKQRGCTIWLTGLPSSGKSTIGFSLEHALMHQGRLAYVLDGDNIRHGLNKNLGFSAKDRDENIRRIGEVTKLFADAGFVSITSFVSPYRADRDRARKLHKEAGLLFVEVFIDTPLEVCEKRDPKGMYKKARTGEIANFTGISDPYEPPEKPEIVLKTADRKLEECVAELAAYLEKQGILLT